MINKKSKKTRAIFSAALAVIIALIPIESNAALLETTEYTFDLSDSIKLRQITENYGTSAREYAVLEVDLNDKDNKLDVLFNPAGFQGNMQMSRLIDSDPDIVGGINGDFFHNTLPTAPLGAVVKDGKLIKNPLWEWNTFADMVVYNNGQIHFAYTHPGVYALNETTGVKIKLLKINEIPNSDLNIPIVFTGEYRKASLGKASSRKDLIEVVVTSDGTVMEVRKDLASTTVPEGGFVIMAKGDAGKNLAENARVGDKIKLKHDKIDGDSGVQMVIGGGSVIVKDGGATPITKKVGGKAQRSAVGVTSDNKLLLLATQGRQSLVPGMDEKDVQNLMIRLGAKDAMMFDGGGSTNLYTDGKMQISQSNERLVNNALIVKNFSDKTPSKINLSILDDMIFEGDTVEVNIAGVDANGNNVANLKTENFTLNVSGVSASIKGRKITFSSAGTATIAASYGGVSASKEVNIIPNNNNDIRFVSKLDNSVFNVFGNMDAGGNLVMEAFNAKLLENLPQSSINLTSFNHDDFFAKMANTVDIHGGYANTTLFANTSIYAMDNTSGKDLTESFNRLSNALSDTNKNMMILLSRSRTMPNKYWQHYFDKIVEQSNKENIYVIYKGGNFSSSIRGKSSYISIGDTKDLTDANNIKYLSFGQDSNGNLLYTFNKVK